MKLIGIIADHPTPKATLDEVMFTTGASDSHRGGGTAWSLDEKMGQTYVHKECANTLAQRDYKQPQAVIYELSGEDRIIDGEQSSRIILRTGCIQRHVRNGEKICK